MANVKGNEHRSTPDRFANAKLRDYPGAATYLGATTWDDLLYELAQASGRQEAHGNLEGQFYNFGIDDFDPPVVDNVTPTAGTEMTAETVVGFRVSDNRAVGLVVLVAEFPGQATVELIWDSETRAFTAPYAHPNSTATPVEVEEKVTRWDFTIARAAGWPRTGVSLRVLAVDTAGNLVEV